MKSYNHLYEIYISEDNIKLAIEKSSKGKRKRKDVSKIYYNQDYYIGIIRNYAENFHNKERKYKIIHDSGSGKERIITSPTYMEQIVHHMIINVLEPIFMHGMYEHSYSSVPGRGCHKGKKVIEKWIHNKSKKYKILFEDGYNKILL